MITKQTLIDTCTSIGMKLTDDKPDSFTVDTAKGTKLVFTQFDSNWVVICNSVAIIFEDAAIKLECEALALETSRRMVGAIYFADI